MDALFILYFRHISLLSSSMTDHFYIHIPFCRERCPYCKFALTPVFDEFKKKRYIEYLKKEINIYFEHWEAVNSAGLGFILPLWKILSICQWSFREYFKCTRVWNTRKRDEYRYQNEPWKIGKVFVTFWQKVRGWTQKRIEDLEISSGWRKTIYFGGWTPSVLSHVEILSILQCFPFYRKSKIEITLEANPEDITIEYIEWILALGINRISLGVQTLNEKSLKEIHRSDQDTICRALASIGTALSRFWKVDISLNIDFILGLPFVKPWETLAGIWELHNKFPFITHTSVYMLEDEAYPKHWKANSITENKMQTEFIAIIEYFESIWWHHYELSNFSKPWYESVHNRAYWDHSNSRGFGLSAASYENQARWSNSSSFGRYYLWKKENEEILSVEQVEIETMMFSLRTNWWNIACASIWNTWKIEELIRDSLLEVAKDKIKPTKTWIFVIDHILSELITDA